MQHQFTLSRPGQLGPQGIGGADAFITQQLDPTHQLRYAAPMATQQAQTLGGRQGRDCRCYTGFEYRIVARLQGAADKACAGT
ncbi:hypothetical protein D3C78_1671910 [compost metagenome]